MSYRHLGTLIILLTSVVACGGDDSEGGGGSVQAACEHSCQIGANLSCDNDNPDTCVSDCVGESEAFEATCAPEIQALAECSLTTTASDYECDANGESNVKAGVCEEEFDAIIACALGG